MLKQNAVRANTRN